VEDLMIEAETRKRTPYTHIPPRVKSGIQRKQIVESQDVSFFQEQDNERTGELQELVNSLRASLEESESHLREHKSLEEHNKKLLIESQKSHDIDLLALQHDNNNLKKRLVEQRKLSDDLEDSNKALAVSQKDILATTHSLGLDLEAERTRSAELMSKLKEEKLKNEAREELQIIVEDLQREKQVLQEELQKMVDNKFTTSRDDEFQLQISTLKTRIAELQNQHAAALREKLDLHKTIEELKAELKSLNNDKRLSDTRQFESQDQLEKLKHRFKVYEHISPEDLEEAMALLQLKREAGVTLEFLSNIGSITEDKQKIKDLKQQYALCAQDLDKMTQLLRVQESINAGYKTEIVQINQKTKMIQNEYEFRLEEYSRLAGTYGLT
jgi:protein fantom